MEQFEKVYKGLEKVWDAFNHMEHELYADYVFDARVLIRQQQERIAELEAELGQRDYNAAVEMQQYCERYEPTYNPEDGSM